VPSDENPACHFAFKDAEHGNAKYFQYVHTANDDGSTTWSASGQMTALPNEPTSSPTSEPTSMVGDPVSQPASETSTTKSPEASAKTSLSVATVTMSASSGGFQTIVTSVPVAPPATITGVRPSSAPNTVSGVLPIATTSQNSTTSNSPPAQKSTNTTAIGVGVGVSVGFMACLAVIVFFFYSKRRKVQEQKPFDSSIPHKTNSSGPSQLNNLTAPGTGYSHNSSIGLVPVEKHQHVGGVDQKTDDTVTYPYVSELGGNNVKGFPVQAPQVTYPQVSELGVHNANAFAPVSAPVPAPPSYSYEMSAHQQKVPGIRNHVELA